MLEVTDSENKKPEETKPVAGKGNSIPLLMSAYFEDRNIRAKAFVSEVHKQEIKRFDDADLQRAFARMADIDSDGERLWQLVSQSPLPVAIEAWVWGAIEKSLANRWGEAFNPAEQSGGELLSSLRRRLARGLASKDKGEKKSAENWLRIGILWLVERRGVLPLQAAEELTQISFPDSRAAAKFATKTFLRGRAGDFKMAIGMAALSQDMLKNAKAREITAVTRAASLGREVEQSNSEIAKLKQQINANELELARQAEELRDLTKQLSDQRQNGAHDLSLLQSQSRILLNDRLRPLICDSIDALEIETPVIRVALDRLKVALGVIEDKTND